MATRDSSKQQLAGWRRWLFVTWVGAAIIAAAAAMVAGPIVSTDGADGTKWVAFISPAAMFVFIVTGLAWLVLHTATLRTKYTRQPPN